MARLHRAALWLAYRLLLVGWFVFRPRRRGVFVAVWHDGRLLVIRNSYRDWLALPAGGPKRGESTLDTALRELREEVGIAARPEALHFACELPSRFEFKRDHCSFFELELVEPVVRHELDELFERVQVEVQVHEKFLVEMVVPVFRHVRPRMRADEGSRCQAPAKMRA